MTEFTCSVCSETKEVQTSGAVGYVVTSANPDEKVCHACAATLDLQDMLKTGKAFLYFDGKLQTVTNCCSSLILPLRSYRKGKHNMGRTRLDFWFKVPGDPYLWHGVHIGEWNTFLRAKRTKTIA